MSFLITADRASDILDFIRGPRFDQHVIAWRSQKWIAEKTEEFAARRAQMEAGAAEIIARAKAAPRCPAYQMAAE